MILSFFGSKVGVVVVALGVCALFIGLSKWKHLSVATENPRSNPAVALALRKPGSALIARAKEGAVGRAEEVHAERQSSRVGGDSYDEVGNPFRRRATPELLSQSGSLSPETTPQISAEADGLLVPSLRIHGRRTAPDKTEAGSWPGSLTSLLPGSAKVVPALGLPSGDSPRAPRPKRFVPFGRLIKAELVITLESTQDEMPLVGVITEPVYNNGRLVIPAGTELHSMARPDRIRDRIVSTAIWRLIFPREGDLPNGRQLVFDGIALDREDRDGNGLTWGLTDGSYGLKGRTVHNGQTQQSLLLFAAEAIKAASASMLDRQQTILGAEVEANARNAGLAGGQAVLSHFAEGIAKEIERNGVYIQVPAGKEFYVYPRQAIDPDRADIPDNIAKVE